MLPLGERIRQLRKERKLTLAEVADGKLTKGMLSLIENGKAQPSMESLQHIAVRLSVDLARLVGNENLEEVRGVLREVEAIWKTVTFFDTELADKVCNLIRPYLSKMPEAYEGAKALQIYCEAFYVTGDEQTKIERYAEQAETIYKKIHLYNEYVKARMFRAVMHFRTHHYSNALKVISELRDEIGRNGWVISEIIQLELLYYEAIFYYAIGEYGSGMAKTDEALAFIKETKIYYLVEELYRLAHFVEMISGKGNQESYYFKKMKQYAEFTESGYAQWYCDFLPVHYYTNYTHEYEKALLMVENMDKRNYGFNQAEAHLVDGFALSERGIALYGLHQYEKALECFEKKAPANYLHHPFDLSMEYQLFAYQALCHLALGNRERAVQEITKAKELIGPMPPTPYKDFILEAHDKIMASV